MSISKSGNKSHDDAVNAAEGARQVATAPGATQAACITAEITFYRIALASAKANGIGIEPIVAVLRAPRHRRRLMATSTESVQFSNIAATPAVFFLRGGNYALSTKATSYGTKLQLELLALDGTTWLNVGSNVTADGVITTFTNLPPGQYRFELASVTGLYLALTRIPT